jgi:hypothetical protein
MTYQSQFERLELKYLVEEALAERLREAVAAYTEPDAFNGTHGRGYVISSLYFDSPSLEFYRAKERRDPDRLKLRARVYDVTGDVSLEIKRKRGDVVWKRRAQVPREVWPDCALGFFDAASFDERQRSALEGFAHLYAQFGCEPKLTVNYEREAYASPHDHYARVTFDRQVTCFPTDRMVLGQASGPSFPLYTGITETYASPVLLELKCEQFMPSWMWDLIHDFQLNRVGYSKYNTGMRAHMNDVYLRDPELEALLHA